MNKKANQTPEVERRYFNIELREVADEAEQKPRIEGYAAVFNSYSEQMWGFREVMEPGFFDDVLSDDVRALFNHDRNFVLGRSKAGTLEMSQNDKGLLVNIDPPETDLVRDMVLTPMKRGDINQMSFAFALKPDGDDWREEEGQLIRVLKKGGALRLFDVSVVTEPAYPETSASVRSKVSEYQQKAEPAEGQETEAGDGNESDPQEQIKSYRRRLAVAG
jgi:uncharacterized protein